VKPLEVYRCRNEEAEEEWSGGGKTVWIFILPIVMCSMPKNRYRLVHREQIMIANHTVLYTRQPGGVHPFMSERCDHPAVQRTVCGAFRSLRFVSAFIFSFALVRPRPSSGRFIFHCGVALAHVGATNEFIYFSQRRENKQPHLHLILDI